MSAGALTEYTSGCISRLMKTTTKRGELVTVNGTTKGLYVGTTKHGTAWYAYRIEDFEPMCRAFDAKAW